ncbi:protein FAR1-RELATED SEQUENCE 6-like isoform X2 [Asparagus officinalis]|uniref:protein FAR1-RELATED SEQUENCE 6-like isoform X2 n=1 Tax=Asparagus officinalis TaxID=4686 RepID=UPI00098DF705|nr:protein FAR1-RELATED SEQUENCE 6-like isoform X2 [Asparagus officinalis]
MLQEDARFNGRGCGRTEIGKLKLAEGDNEVIHQFFASMQSKNPNFFYLVDFDEHERLRNLFWADARSRAAYQYFGDVVTFDTSYLTDKYDLPLVSFVGMNHHGHLVLLGCGLVSDETTETYIWLFKAWLTCMLGCPPNAIITNQCKSIQNAVAEVFPGTHHRLCLSQVLKKIPDKLRGLAEFKAIKKAIKKVAYDSLRVEEFEEYWQKMIETYELESNEWLKILYEDRHSWVPVFLKDNTFWAGMSVSQRGESVTTFFEGCVFPRTSIKQFFSKCEMALLSKFKKEAQTDSETFHKTPLIISKFYMEEQLSKVYTLNMFKKFQDELKATMYCHVTPVKVDGSIFTFEIKECSYIEDGKRTESKDYQVLFNADDVVVQCICGFFNFHGILCRHVLSVFKFQQIFEIPSHYILDRWKKDFKQLHAMARSSDDAVVNNLPERYDYLSSRFLQLVDVGFISEDRYRLSLKLIKEIEKSLLDDTSGRDNQPKLLCFDTHSNQNVQNLLVSQLGFTEDNANSNSNLLPVKRRGRPPKKGRVCNVEPLVRTNKEQDFLRSAMIANEDNVLQAAPTVSHLDTHIGQGGINLMGQYDQQTMVNQNGFPWIYQQILQEDQISKVPSVRRTG